MATVREVLDQLIEGEITTEEAADEFAFIDWPDPVRKTTVEEIERDPDPAVPDDGGFFAVTEAYSVGQLDDAQYAALAEAYAESRQ